MTKITLTPQEKAQRYDGATPSSKVYIGLYDNQSLALIEQPYGSQASPDFLFYVDGKCVLKLELKATFSDGSKPVWNAHIPRSDVVYMYYCGKHQYVTFRLGSQLISTNNLETLALYRAELDAFKAQLDAKYAFHFDEFTPWNVDRVNQVSADIWLPKHHELRQEALASIGKMFS